MAIGVLLVLLIVVFLFVFGGMIFGNAELVDGTELPGARIVKDSYVALDVLPTGEKEVAFSHSGPLDGLTALQQYQAE